MGQASSSVRGSTTLAVSILLGLLPIVAMAGLWWFLTAGPVENRHIGPSILPSPAEVFNPQHSLRPLLVERSLAHNIWISIRRIALGYHDSARWYRGGIVCVVWRRRRPRYATGRTGTS